MKGLTCQRLPLLPLLRTYLDAGLSPLDDLGRLPLLGPRVQAVLAARTGILSESLVNHASDPQFQDSLAAFYVACVPPGLLEDTVRRRAGKVRHAVTHLLRGRDSVARKLQHFLGDNGPYRVAGLGPAFWSALVQGVNPTCYPAWLPGVVAGLRRLGLARWRKGANPGQVYGAILDAYDQIRSLISSLTALHVDHFLVLVATMQGRSLWSGNLDFPGSTSNLEAILHRERSCHPLRERLKDCGQAHQQARQDLETGLANRDSRRIAAALSPLKTKGGLAWTKYPDSLCLWVDRLWNAEDPYAVLEAFHRADPLPGAGLWLPAAVLHLKDFQRFSLWNEAARTAYGILADGQDVAIQSVDQYRLFNEATARLSDRHHIHSLEMPDILAALAEPEKSRGEAGKFGGFCTDTFRFLAELAQNNRRDWMELHRDRYRFAVREPLLELCRLLTDQYVHPVLRGVYGWDLGTAARKGGALTRLGKNDFGRSVPYQTTFWITFFGNVPQSEEAAEEAVHPPSETRAASVQFFVRLDQSGISYGWRLGLTARKARCLFRQQVQEHSLLLHRALEERGALSECWFGTSDDPATWKRACTSTDLQTWAEGEMMVAGKAVAAEQVPAMAEDMVGDILLTFDRLLPAYVCAVATDPQPMLARWAGTTCPGLHSTEIDFRKATFLGEDWLDRARSLLDLKRQLILQGVPGTGKTHVARCLARLLTRGDDDRVRLVQFHPAYSYEEFVEGIKVRSVEGDGRFDVTYPVEDGLLCAFAGEASRRPAEPHVLIIDEINRGNLPRVFGELLYLLEYRDQSISLPYSRRKFRLPANLYLLATMNAADRSVALVDQALRRRFSFLDMPPDRAVLASWLHAQLPASAKDFALTVVTLFDRLNSRLRRDLGPSFQVGHSYFMVPDLDQARLQVVWNHHIQPLLEEYFSAHPGRLTTYALDKLLPGASAPRGHKRQPANKSI